MRISSAFLLPLPGLILAQQGTAPTCTLDGAASLALTSVILGCYSELGADPGATVTVTNPSAVPCYRISRDGSSISEVVVRRLEGRDTPAYTATKAQVACAVKEILGSCLFGDGGRLVGGVYGVCGSGDLYVQVQGQGN